jgi:hypothetical protein
VLLRNGVKGSTAKSLMPQDLFFCPLASPESLAVALAMPTFSNEPNNQNYSILTINHLTFNPLGGARDEHPTA